MTVTIREWLRPPQWSLAILVALLAAIAIGATALAWRVVAEDRALANERERARLEQAGDLVVADLREAWAAVDTALTSRLAGRDASAHHAPAAVTFIGFTDHIEIDPPGRLAFDPAADQFRPDDPDAARMLADAAALRSGGRNEEALSLYARLGESDGVLLNAPAPVVAHHARGLIYEALGHPDELQQEARALADALHRRPSLVSAGVYRFYSNEAIRWMGQDQVPAGVRLREARAGLVAGLWQRWHDAGALPPLRVEWIDDLPFTVLTRQQGERLVAVVGDPELPGELLASGSGHSRNPSLLNLAFVDAAGRPVAGELPSDDAPSIMSAAVSTGLPWTMQVSPGPEWIAESVSGGTRLLAWSIALAAVGVLLGGGFMARAMYRELALARVKSDFVAAVSHELRTPLAAVRQVTELLADGRVASESERDDYYRRLGHASGRLNRLVEDLLDFKRLEAGKLEFAFAPVDPVEMVGAVVNDVRGTTPSTRIDLAANGTAAPVRADREALGRAVRNLLDNAIKYSPEGSPVDVSVSSSNGRVAIAVRDRGPGIPAERQQAVFDTFVRGPGSHHVPGTGIGLTMVRHIVDAHGGRVTLDSQPGGGSTFVIELPAHA